MKKFLYILIVFAVLFATLGASGSPAPAASPARPTLSSPGNNSSWPQSTVIELKWNSVAGATQYKVELWGGPYSLMVPCNWISGTSCWIGTMWPGTMYWHVKARNANGESDWSDTWAFVIQNSGGTGGGGTGGSGGGSTPTPSCTMEPVPGFTQIPGVNSDLFKLPLPPEITPIVIVAPEYRASFSMQYCDPLVTLNFQQEGHLNGLSVNGPGFNVDFGNDLNPTGVEVSTTDSGKFGTSLDYGNEKEGVYPYIGTWYGTSVDQKIDSLDYFTYDATHQFRTYINPNPNFLELPAFHANPRVSATISIAVIFATTIKELQPLSEYIQNIMNFIENSVNEAGSILPVAPVAAQMPINTSPSLVSYRVPSFSGYNVLQLLRPSLPSAMTLDLLHQQYGPLVDMATVGTLHTSKSVISAYTIFSFDGSGFTPLQPVFVDFWLPDNPILLNQVVVADENGHISGTFEMPTPDKVTLGTYLISAVDYASLNNSINAVADGQATTLSTYMAGTTVDVVEDTIPPTITINSPSQGQVFTRCDQPLVDFSVTDDLSGVKTVNSLVDGTPVTSGTRLDVSFWNLGTHTLTIDATDKMNLPSHSEVNFSLIPTIQGARCALSQFYGLGLIKNQGIYKSLDAKLAAAQASLDGGRQKTEANQLQATLNELNAQQGKGVVQSAYAILNGDLSAIENAIGK